MVALTRQPPADGRHQTQARQGSMCVREAGQHVHELLTLSKACSTALAYAHDDDGSGGELPLQIAQTYHKLPRESEHKVAS